MSKRFVTVVAIIVIAALVLAIVGLGALRYVTYRRASDNARYSNTQMQMTQTDLSEALNRYLLLSDEDAAQVQEQMPRFTGERVQLVFTGCSSPDQMMAIEEILENRDLTGHFFFTEGEMIRNYEAINILLDRGCPVGLLYEDQVGTMDTARGEEMVRMLCPVSFVLRAAYGMIHVPVMSVVTPGMEARKAISALGFDNIVVTKSEIALADCVDQDIAGKLLLGVNRGDIVRIHLPESGIENEGEHLEALLDALVDTNARIKAQQRLAVWRSSWGLAYPLRRIDTIEEGAIFSFQNLVNDAELDNVLKVLKALNGKGMFYVTLNEAVHQRERVLRVLNDGHELGIFVPDIDSPSAEEYLTEMISVDEEIRLQFGYEKELPVYVPYDQDFNLLKAASAGGFSLTTSYLLPVRAQDTRKTGHEDEIMLDILSRFDRTIHRGELVHFELGQFLNSNEMSARLVYIFATQRCVYPLKAYHDMLENRRYLWHYPLTTNQILPSVRGLIRRGQFLADVASTMTMRYIGAPWMNKPDTLIGFDENEIRKIDKTGVIPGHPGYVYLTFNDSEQDAFTTPILKVLEKHNAKATFFVRTEVSDWNPNLFRAIAAGGHAIAIRADKSFEPLLVASVAGNAGMQQAELDTRIFQADAKKAYDNLASIMGDLMLDSGMPALTTYFRPPLEETSKDGMAAVYDSGFTWAIEGIYKSQERIEKAVDENGKDVVITDADILNSMIAATRGGAVLSLSDPYAEDIDMAQILDRYLGYMEGNRKQFRFVTLTDGLEY